MTRRAALVAVVIAGLAIHPGAAQQQSQRPEQVPGAIRSRITLVPLDVRVLDRNGMPVTGLTEKDFTVYEDGRRQTIGHFAYQELTPGAPGPARPPLRKALDATIEEQRHRTFLIVLGRGRLHGWGGGYQAAIRFVKEQALPQDKIAIAAWNRATDFTTDHARLVPLLERLRNKHQGLELKLRLRESGLEGIFGSKTIPADLQRDIDAIFDEPALRPRELAAVRIRDEKAYENAMRQQFDAVMDRMLGEGRLLNDPRLEDFYVTAAIGRSTLATLYSSIEYLKYFDGEKHLILLNDSGIYLPRAEDDEGLAASAADARVAVHTILTGGVPSAFADLDMSRGGYGDTGYTMARPSPLTLASLPAPAGTRAFFALGTMRTFARRSGGYFSVTERASRVFDRIDAATRSQYVLGYYPSNAAWNGEYREIDVRVARPDVTVAVRRGYFATDQLVPFDRRQFLTHSRVATAAEHSRPITDIRLEVKARVEHGEVIVEGTIDPSRLTLEPIDGVRGGEVDVAVFAGDRSEEIVGERWQKISLKLGEKPYERLSASGIPFTVRVPVSGQPRYVKVIVYDYAADLVGSAMVKLR